MFLLGLHSPHEGLAGGSGQTMSSLAYYQPEHPGSAGVVKYPENGHDTLSDFVTFVCQEAENTQQLPQVASVSDLFNFLFSTFKLQARRHLIFMILFFLYLFRILMCVKEFFYRDVEDALI